MKGRCLARPFSLIRIAVNHPGTTIARSALLERNHMVNMVAIPRFDQTSLLGLPVSPVPSSAVQLVPSLLVELLVLVDVIPGHSQSLPSNGCMYISISISISLSIA